MVAIGIVMIFAEALQNVYLFKLGLWSLHSSLPIHLCGVAGIIAGIMMINPKQDGFEFLALIGFPGALHAIFSFQVLPEPYRDYINPVIFMHCAGLSC